MDQQIMKPALAESAAPIVSAPLKYGTLRIFIDFLKLKAVEKREMYPLSRMDDFYDFRDEATNSSSLDANRGNRRV